MGQEVLLLALLERLAVRVPALVVEAAHQHGQLGGQIGGLLHRQAVAQRVQDGRTGAR